MARRSLGRDRFRDGVFARDRHRCVVCSAPAVDAHHLLERRLFADGGAGAVIVDRSPGAARRPRLTRPASHPAAKAVRIAL